MAIYTIPLVAGTPQTFPISLGGTPYTLAFRYRNTVEGGWIMDIADAGGNAILNGVPMVTGANLLAQYAHLGFQGGLFVQTTTDPDAVPTFGNIGTDALLYWVTST